jgi:LytS/YehU family sensor histidine kinase
MFPSWLLPHAYTFPMIFMLCLRVPIEKCDSIVSVWWAPMIQIESLCIVYYLVSSLWCYQFNMKSVLTVIRMRALSLRLYTQQYHP